jgi:hypothetical protein
MAKVRKDSKKEEPTEGGPWVTRSGTVITEEIAEEWAEEAERDGADIPNLKRRYVGRPSLGGAGRSPRVSFRVSPELSKAAWKRADEEGRALSDLAREALERYLDS